MSLINKRCNVESYQPIQFFSLLYFFWSTLS
nr:MAG TPA: hypothetical protein [Caudoviricetes sp.]